METARFEKQLQILERAKEGETVLVYAKNGFEKTSREAYDYARSVNMRVETAKAHVIVGDDLRMFAAVTVMERHQPLIPAEEPDAPRRGGSRNQRLGKSAKVKAILDDISEQLAREDDVYVRLNQGVEQLLGVYAIYYRDYWQRLIGYFVEKKRPVEFGSSTSGFNNAKMAFREHLAYITKDTLNAFTDGETGILEYKDQLPKEKQWYADLYKICLRRVGKEEIENA